MIWMIFPWFDVGRLVVLNPSSCLCDIEVLTSKVDLLVILPLGCVNWYQSKHSFESSSFESMCSKVVLVFQFDFCFYQFLPNFHNARKFSNLSLRASIQPHSTLSCPSRTRPKLNPSCWPPKLNPSCWPLHPCKLLPKLSLKLIPVKLLAQSWHL